MAAGWDDERALDVALVCALRGLRWRAIWARAGAIRDQCLLQWGWWWRCCSICKV